MRSVQLLFICGMFYDLGERKKKILLCHLILFTDTVHCSEASVRLLHVVNGNYNTPMIY